MDGSSLGGVMRLLSPFLSLAGCLLVAIGITSIVVGVGLDSMLTLKAGIVEIVFGLSSLFLFFVDRGSV